MEAERSHNRSDRKPSAALVDSYSVDGKNLSQLATALLTALSDGSCLSTLDVYCAQGPASNFPAARFPRARVLPELTSGKAWSLLRAAKRIGRGRYDLAIFNMFPTSFGPSTFVNAVGVLAPLLVSQLSPTPVALIYHNSTFTNDIQGLGYSRTWDSIRARVLRQIEKLLFRKTRAFVLLEMYRARINSELGYDAVSHFDIRCLDALGSAYLAGLMETTKLDRAKFRNANSPSVLLHGSWGPQKDLEFALETLRNLRRTGIDFQLILSGSVNPHFPGYVGELERLRHKYREVIDDYRGSVSDNESCRLFLSADLALLPYNVPGGVSGVLETAIFFGTPVVGLTFPEFKEEARGVERVQLCERSDFEAAVRTFLTTPRPDRDLIDLAERLESARRRVAAFLDAALSRGKTNPD